MSIGFYKRVLQSDRSCAFSLNSHDFFFSYIHPVAAYTFFLVLLSLRVYLKKRVWEAVPTKPVTSLFSLPSIYAMCDVPFVILLHFLHDRSN